jgi:hypothetical protein
MSEGNKGQRDRVERIGDARDAVRLLLSFLSYCPSARGKQASARVSSLSVSDTASGAPVGAFQAATSDGQPIVEDGVH